MEPTNLIQWIVVIFGYAAFFLFLVFLWFGIAIDFLPDEWLFPDDSEPQFDIEAELEAIEWERRRAVRELAQIRRQTIRDMDRVARSGVIDGTASEIEVRR